MGARSFSGHSVQQGSASPATASSSLALALAAFEREAAMYEAEQQAYNRLQARRRPLLLMDARMQSGPGRLPYPYGLFLGRQP